MKPHFHLPHLERLQGRACNKIRIDEISSFMAADIDVAEQTEGESVIAQGHITRQGPLHIQNAIEDCHWKAVV